MMHQSLRWKGPKLLLVARGGWRDDSPIAPREEGAKTRTKKSAKKKKTKKKNFETHGKKGSAASASFTTIDLGRGKTVEIFIDAEAENVGDVDFDDVSAEEGISFLTRLNGNLYGAGDVIWPSSQALARLVAHVPSLVKNKDCIDIGAGLGLVSAAAIMSQAKIHPPIKRPKLGICEYPWKRKPKSMDTNTSTSQYRIGILKVQQLAFPP